MNIGSVTSSPPPSIWKGFSSTGLRFWMIQRKSHSFLTKISKEDHPNVEHLEYREDPYEADEMQQEMQKELLQQNPSAHVPASVHSSSPDKNHHPNEPYILMSDNNSSSFLLQQRTNNQIEYSGEIPEIFVNYSYFKSQNSNFELPEPPQLPAHLNNVLLNKLSNHNNSNTQLPAHNTSYPPHTHNYSSDNGTMPQLDTFKPPSASFMGESSSSKRPPLRRADSSYYASNQEAYHLSIPNHVILNHLMTTSIRNDVLTVACITRYSGKFVTQIMHSPADSLSGES
ncbi:hypothetical protein CANTEDRAFT_94253 [Yamadazyma tenuis ATCC 10573]|uniref:Association with the SNF1 complex (ASC) domain-containing protein n=1 Tax=Candida tenuis (strain ATCC 10573 / BCRC 21748 / CBS 615 / JCM 9827 / NBRC 10315 / NRRL Y-1498 / VKM Y-70) TaxID=590646 RepID=G3B9W9_CANTC|nr:uncharacterized protein CANTEDRAFT_94253 [Yamadazyma tenuis ATCC 10573]EGV61345.1 hypothetical protein CANTEDRAFT_94253 [Yamadazyma tenuis ATCC 10573]